jgi:hypothetical protein
MIELLLEILTYLLLWSVIGFVILLAIPYTREAIDLDEVFNPKEIYDSIEVNWFGCIMLTILFNILCPPLSIGYWFYTICTIGRKC